MKIIAIVPCYNSEGFIEDTLIDIKRFHKDILVVDDGSSDNSYNEMKRVKNIKILRHPTNRGKGEALKTGFKYAIENGYDAVLTIDSDGQHKASDIPKFLRAFHKHDITIGSRMHNVRNMPLRRILANSVSSFFVSIKCNQRVSDSQSGYRLIKRDVIKNVRTNQEGYQMETEILINASRQGYKIGSVSIKTIYGKEVSHINPLKVTWRFLRVIFQ